MARYIWRGNQFVDPSTLEPMHIPERDGVCIPAVYGDIPDYQSPITGQVVSGRSARREEFKKFDVIEKPPLPKEKRFCHSRKWAERLGYEWTGKKA